MMDNATSSNAEKAMRAIALLCEMDQRGIRVIVQREVSSYRNQRVWLVQAYPPGVEFSGRQEAEGDSLVEVVEQVARCVEAKMAEAAAPRKSVG